MSKITPLNKMSESSDVAKVIESLTSDNSSYLQVYSYTYRWWGTSKPRVHSQDIEMIEKTLFDYKNSFQAISQKLFLKILKISSKYYERNKIFSEIFNSISKKILKNIFLYIFF